MEMPPPVFRNRESELERLLTAGRAGRRDNLWVVVAPPTMGKTWLLARMEGTLVDGGQTVTRLDLRRASPELRANPVRLLGELLQLDLAQAQSPSDVAIRAATDLLASRDRPPVVVLDSADLLVPSCRTALRAMLLAVDQAFARAGRAGEFAAVIATRTLDDWSGITPGTVGRFRPLALDEFGESVCRAVVADLGANVDEQQHRDLARQLQAASFGLPALLYPSLRWLVQTRFVRPMDEDALLDDVARPYVLDELLSADCLLPAGSPRLQQALAVLRGAVRALSTYRLYTRSHLTFQLDKDPALRELVDEVGWTTGELWEALGRTALQATRNPREIWLEIEPPLRRLLYSYHHRGQAERASAHAEARSFYSGWDRDRSAGKEQHVVLVECLWHEAARLSIEEPDTLPERLPRVAVELARALGGGSAYALPEFRNAVVRRMSDDDELRELLDDHASLFDAVINAVATTLGDIR